MKKLTTGKNAGFVSMYDRGLNRIKENSFMLARLEMKLSKTEDMSYQKASIFHGALMELISEEYADELHLSKLHPYTQHLERRSEDWYWVVTTLSEKAHDEIIQNKLLRVNGVYLFKKDLKIDIIEKNHTIVEDADLAKSFYNEKPERYITLKIVTPLSFKTKGRYINYPDIRLIYQSIMNKYDSVNADEAIYDEETLDELTQNTALNRYELRSMGFSLEGIKIPSFIGKMTLRVGGTQTMCSFANMLFRFSEYSGIGIKTALGMGAISLEKKKQNNLD